MTYRAAQAGFKIVEIPICFRERRAGASKMRGWIVAEAVWKVPCCGFGTLTRLLITGGARLRRLQPRRLARHAASRVGGPGRCDNLYRRGSELNLPRLEEAGVEFVKGDVREPADLQALPELTRADRVLGRALGDERRRRRHRLPRPHQPHRRLQLPRAGAARRRLRGLPLDQPRLPGRAAGGAEAGGGRDPLRDRRRAGGAGRLGRRASPRSSRSREPAPSTGRPSSPPRC